MSSLKTAPFERPLIPSTSAVGMAPNGTLSRISPVECHELPIQSRASNQESSVACLHTPDLSELPHRKKSGGKQRSRMVSSFSTMSSDKFQTNSEALLSSLHSQCVPCPNDCSTNNLFKVYPKFSSYIV